MVRVGVRCDVGVRRGIGHVMRCLAFAEELRARGVDVVFVCDSPTVPWVDAQITERGIPVEPAVWTPGEHVEMLGRLKLDAVVFDSYDLPGEVFSAVRRTGVPTLAIVDGELRGADADVLVDQNLRAEFDQPVLPEGAVRLAGLDYVLLRDEVLAWRPVEPPVLRPSGTPKVFAFFGGTDAYGAGPYVVQALAASGAPFDATVVAPGDELAKAIAAVALGQDQRVQVIGPTSQLAQAVVESDLVISASGTSTWELLCLGATAGLVCVVDNQELGYERAVATGAAAGVGTLAELKADPTAAAAVLRTLLTDAQERAQLAQAGWKLVDGRGRVRVADTLLRLLDAAT
ncbi:spore coat protein [Kribbella sp. NPDC023855]|uniref:PseG/SpsG family protein n=1 Tax=Kribbella sp. NPDC023855 TaxID=3154698 RepID=UPI0033D1625B